MSDMRVSRPSSAPFNPTRCERDHPGHEQIGFDPPDPLNPYAPLMPARRKNLLPRRPSMPAIR